MSWLAAERLISKGTPSFGGNSHRHRAPMAENPNPDSPLISAEAPRIQASARTVASENSPAMTENGKAQTQTLSSAAQNAVMSSIEPTVTRETVGQIGQERPISTS